MPARTAAWWGGWRWSRAWGPAIARMAFGVALASMPPRAVAAGAPNDSRALAASVGGSTFVLSADLAGATLEPFEAEDSHLTGQTLWWRWLAPADGVVAWSASGSTNPVHVLILEVDPLAQGTVVAETYLRPQEPSPGGFFGPSLIPDPTGTFPARAGGEYWIRLDGVRVSGGGLILLPDPAAPYPVVSGGSGRRPPSEPG